MSVEATRTTAATARRAALIALPTALRPPPRPPRPAARRRRGHRRGVAASKMLGHSSIAITSDTYSHLLRGVGRQAAEAAMALVPRRDALTIPSQEPGDDEGPPPRTAKGQVRLGAPSGTRTPNPLIKSQGSAVSDGDD
jgi:hypothetical protein